MQVDGSQSPGGPEGPFGPGAPGTPGLPASPRSPFFPSLPMPGAPGAPKWGDIIVNFARHEYLHSQCFEFNHHDDHLFPPPISLI